MIEICSINKEDKDLTGIWIHMVNKISLWHFNKIIDNKSYLSRH
jgi:hypothetical protein